MPRRVDECAVILPTPVMAVFPLTPCLWSDSLSPDTRLAVRVAGDLGIGWWGAGNASLRAGRLPWQLVNTCQQCLSQNLETGCLKLAVVKFWGVHTFKGITIY